MPSASTAPREKWGGQYGICEDKATEFLKERGWTMSGNGLWTCPADRCQSELGDDEWEALQFLIDEWDHDFIPHPDDD